MNIVNETPQVVNRGTGAGGANTNINGNRLEEKVRSCYDTHIITEQRLAYNRNNRWLVQTVGMDDDGVFIRAPQNAFKCFEENCGYANDTILKLHGAKQPDDCFINEQTNTINWIECKSQGSGGSVGEKLQTFSEKIINLEKRFPGWKINYCYIINPYIRTHYRCEIQRLEEKNISYICSDDENFENKLLELLK
tara:strand:+ start:259 stop:840 length:582 start_codon:yes stop_codon:yes gene_type:complete